MLPSCLFPICSKIISKILNAAFHRTRMAWRVGAGGEGRETKFCNTISQMFILLAKAVACTIIKSSHDPRQAVVCRVRRRRLNFVLCQGQNESLIWLQKMHIHPKAKHIHSSLSSPHVLHSFLWDECTGQVWLPFISPQTAQVISKPTPWLSLTCPTSHSQDLTVSVKLPLSVKADFHGAHKIWKSYLG